jgi:hypothetical protein
VSPAGRHRVQAAHRVGVEPVLVVGGRQRLRRRADRAEADDVADQPDAGGLHEQRAGHRAERDARGRLPGAGAFQHRPRVVEAVLLHAGQVGVPRARPGQRRGAGLVGEQVGGHRVGGHHGLPLGPLGVADLDGDRAALGEPVADAAEQRHLVALELHAGAAAVAEPAPGQRVRDVRGTGLDARGHSFEDRDKGGSVRLPRGEPTQHAGILPCRAGPPGTRPPTKTSRRRARSADDRSPAAPGVLTLAVWRTIAGSAS